VNPSLKSAEELPVRVYSPERAIKHPAVMLNELWTDIQAGRELAWRLFVRDVKAQYRQTYFGYLWAFVPPLVGAITFIFLQSQGITNIQRTPIPYPAFVMIGTMLWQTFAEATLNPLLAINSSKPMLVKLNFPRESILMAGMYMVSFNMLIRFILLAVVLLLWKIVPGATLVGFPVAVFGLLICGFAIGLMILPIGTLYGDIARGFPILLQLGMFLTPVVYPARTEGLAGWLARWNPISPLIETARASLTGQPLTYLPQSLLVIMVGVAITVLGLLLFRLVMAPLIERMGG
jgi:lipopolysaccharide transport system permease protein